MLPPTPPLTRVERCRSARASRPKVPLLRRRAACIAGLAVLVGCSAEPAKAPHPKRPLDESRAVELIAKAIADERLTPTNGSAIALPRGRTLRTDLGVDGMQIAIAYVTAPERTELGSAIPAHDVGSTALTIVRDPGNQATRILILHDLAYMTDDHEGDEREVTSVMVEHRLQRDVKDFLAAARRQGWP